MLKKKRIPSPLPLIAQKKMEVRELKAPPRFRKLFVARMMLSWLWHIILIRWRPAAARSGKHAEANFAYSLRLSFERLGGMWIKAAQILAMRRDLFSYEICAELGKLHDHATGFSGHVAIKIIEEELGCELQSVFSEFDPVPLAAASIGQVHVGRLRDNGVKVAIKVQRPTIAASFHTDLQMLAFVVNFLGRFSALAFMRFDEMYIILERTLLEELDYRIEAASTKRMRKSLKWQKIYAPKPYMKYARKRVLVAEFLDGVLMSEYLRVLKQDPAKAAAWCKENEIKPKTVGRKLFMSLISQVTVNNLLHSDLHPGNIMMLKKNKFAFIDFGTINTFDKGFLEKYRLFIRALAARDWSKYTDALLVMVSGVPMDIDLNAARKELIRELEQWEVITAVKGIGYEPKSITLLNTKMTLIASRYRMPFPWDFLRYLRSQAGLDASMAYLDPDMDFLKAVQNQVRTANRQMIRYLTSKDSREDAIATVGDAMRLPKMLGESLFFEAELGRKRALSFQGQITKAAKIGRALLSTCINVGLLVAIIASAHYWVKQTNAGNDVLGNLPVRDIFSTMPHLPPGVWVLVIIVLLYLLRSLKRLVDVLGVSQVGTNPFV